MTVPSASSSSPTISAKRAPVRSAAFICDFIERPSKARSAREPGARAARCGEVDGGRRRRWRRSRSTSTADVGRREHALGVAGEQDALDAAAEADAGRGRAAELLDEAVVAAAAEDGGLGVAEGVALELEERCACSSRGRGRASGSSSNGDARARARPACTRSPWATRLGVEASRRSGARRRARPGSSSRFESSTRSGCASTFSASSGARSPDAAAQPRLQARRRRRARSAGVPMKLRTSRHRRRPSAARKRAPEGDDLDVEVGVGRADGLDADLVVLAEPARLRALVAERRGGVPDLPRRGRVVLDEGPGHRRGALGPQRDVAAALVLEVVHLLGDDVGALADALEHADVLEHRRLDQPVAVAAGERRRTWPSSASQRADSGGRTSWVPLGARKDGRSGMASEATGRPSRAPKSVDAGSARRRGGRPRRRGSRPGR